MNPLIYKGYKARFSVSVQKVLKNGIFPTYWTACGIVINSSSNDNKIISNRVISNPGLGFDSYGSSRNKYILNTSSLSGDYGFKLVYYSQNNEYINNTATSITTGAGFFLNHQNNINNTFRGNTSAFNSYGITCNSPSNYIYHNNIYSNSTLNASSNLALELSYDIKNTPYNLADDVGNWWGWWTTPGFHLPGRDAPPYDSNASTVIDSHPYLVKDGWLKGYAPGQIEPTPPVIYHPEPGGGYKGGAFSFDGVNDKMTVSDTDSLRPTNMSIEFWVKPFAVKSYNQVIAGKVGGTFPGSRRGFELLLIGTFHPEREKVNLAIFNLSENCTNSISVLATKTWYHIVGTYDGISIKMYVNGVLESTTPFAGGLGDTTGAVLGIGFSAFWNGNFFKGLLDEIRIYNRALTGGAISDLYFTNKPITVTSKGVGVPKFPGLVSWWSGDGTAKDLWGGNNGTLQNGATYTDIAALTATRPTISASFFDKFPGIDRNTARIFLKHPNEDFKDVTNPDLVTNEGISYTPSADLSSGEYTVMVEVKDFAGNKAEAVWSFRIISPDTTPPTTTHTATPLANLYGWNNTNVTVKLEATDPEPSPSGVKEIHYRIDNQPEIVVAGNRVDIYFFTEGVFTLSYYAIDNANNVEQTKELVVRIDRTKPTITYNKSPSANKADWNNSDVTVTFYATDDRSGVSDISPLVTISTEGANQQVIGTAVDYAGNSATINVVVNLDNTPPVIGNLPAEVITDEGFSTITITPTKSDNLTSSAQLVWGIKHYPFKNTTAPFIPISVTMVADTITISAPNPDINGTGGFDLTLTDLAGLSVTRHCDITITAINDSPTITLLQPGMVSGQVISGTTKIRWSVNDIEGDTLTISISYSVNDTSWVTIYSFTATKPYNVISYDWNTNSVLDNNAYKVRVVCSDGLATSTSESKYPFTIDNQPLKIKALAPTPKYPNSFNPYYYEKAYLPFELSEPATNITVTLYQLKTGVEKYYGVITNYPYYLGAGINVVEWDGTYITYTDSTPTREVAPAGDVLNYFFQVEVPIAGVPITDKSLEGVGIRTDQPIFYDLKATPDIIWYPVTSTTISFRTNLLISSVWLRVYTETGTAPVATLIPGVNYPSGGPYTAIWNGAGIIENGIFRYKFTASNAAPASGIIRAIKPDTLVTTATNLTVYSSPTTTAVTITATPTLPLDVSYSLRELSVISPSYVYTVSSFYDINAVGTVVTPVVLAFSYSPNLSPYNLKLYQYEPSKGFIAVTRYSIDLVNHILYAEVDKLSLFILMISEDTVKPEIKDVILSPQTVSFSITDDVSGMNLPSIRVILDGVDITDKLTISGAMGDLIVSVSGTNLYEPTLGLHTLTIIAQDRGGNEVSKTISFTTGYADVKVVIKPEALNINPGILTCYVKFPDYFGVPITLDATLDGGALDKWMIDYDGVLEEGLEGPVVVIKFRRADIEKALTEQGEKMDTEFVLKGTFNDGSAPSDLPYQFEGKDSITKIINEKTTFSGSSASDSTTQPSDKGGKKK
ncbi:MAG: right-handed parallel beta-helix repeat-containing protein [Planctomycetota bacterium]|nr:right-handed parallel beta-helix repeat-containing protein [Planctomycetota bacterium]